MLTSSVQGFSLTVQEQGLKGLVRGWAPTLVGYSVQGAGKFGEYPLIAISRSSVCRTPCCTVTATFLLRGGLYLQACTSTLSSKWPAENALHDVYLSHQQLLQILYDVL